MSQRKWIKLGHFPNFPKAVAAGGTALHYAASKGHVQLVKLMLDRGGRGSGAMLGREDRDW